MGKTDASAPPSGVYNPVGETAEQTCNYKVVCRLSRRSTEAPREKDPRARGVKRGCPRVGMFNAKT